MIRSALLLLVIAVPALAADQWLSLAAKHWAPRVTSKSGIGTSRAAVEAKVTRQDIEGWCANWTPDDKDCVARELNSEPAKKTYRATADCPGGKITAADGTTYTLAGVWDASDIGAGQTRWRDPSGAIVGRDNASGGLDIAQQWEVLCPGPVKAVARPPAAAKPAPTAPVGAYAVGETVEAKFGREWVRGKVEKVRQVTGARGPELNYDVRLENGQRGILPPRMLRKPAS